MLSLISAGTILSPTAALRPIDATYRPGSIANGLAGTSAYGQGQAVWTAHSQAGASSSWSVLAVALPEPHAYPLKPHELWPKPNVIVEKNASALWTFTWGAAGCAAGRAAAECLSAVTEDRPLSLVTPKRNGSTLKLPLQHSVVVTELEGGWVVLVRPVLTDVCATFRMLNPKTRSFAKAGSGQTYAYLKNRFFPAGRDVQIRYALRGTLRLYRCR